MDSFQRKDLESLIQDRQGSPCISLFMPAHRINNESIQDPIRFKNLLGRAAAELKTMQVDEQSIDKMLQPARNLIDEQEFWLQQSDGLAAFIAPDFFKTYRIQVPFDESVHIGTSFIISALIPVLTGERRFYLLGLTKRGATLYSGTRDGLKKVEHAMLPQTLQEALHAGIAEDDLRGENDKPIHEDHIVLSINHNQGAHANNKDRHTATYFQQLALSLDEFFKHHPHVPLVIAGVEELHPVYRAANNYEHLLEEGVVGNPDALGMQRLHHDAWEIVEKHFKGRSKKAIESYQRAKDGGLYSTDLQAVLKAAHEGRVMDLFIAQDAHTWGKFDSVSGNVLLENEVVTQEKTHLENLAATRAILTDSDVYILPQVEMPDGATVAARMRY